MVLRRRMLLFQLSRHWRNPLLSRGGNFRWQRPATDPSRSVITCPSRRRRVYGRIVNHHRVCHRPVVNANVGDRNIVDGAVVLETISAPVSSLIARAYITESVVNAAVVADVPAPEAVVETVPSAHKPPISGRPQQSHFRWPRPCARHPVV